MDIVFLFIKHVWATNLLKIKSIINDSTKNYVINSDSIPYPIEFGFIFSDLLRSKPVYIVCMIKGEKLFKKKLENELQAYILLHEDFTDRVIINLSNYYRKLS